MKKVIIALLIIVIILFIANFTRNIILLNNLESVAKSTNLENVYVKHTLINQKLTTELFQKDNIVLIKEYYDNNLDYVCWKNFDTNEEKSFELTGEEIDFNSLLLESITKTILFEDFPLKDKIIFSAFHIIKADNEIITLSDSNILYSYRRDNGTLVQYRNAEVVNSRYVVEIGNVKDTDVSKPEI